MYQVIYTEKIYMYIYILSTNNYLKISNSALLIQLIYRFRKSREHVIRWMTCTLPMRVAFTLAAGNIIHILSLIAWDFRPVYNRGPIRGWADTARRGHRGQTEARRNCDTRLESQRGLHKNIFRHRRTLRLFLSLFPSPLPFCFSLSRSISLSSQASTRRSATYKKKKKKKNRNPHWGERRRNGLDETIGFERTRVVDTSQLQLATSAVQFEKYENPIFGDVCQSLWFFWRVSGPEIGTTCVSRDPSILILLVLRLRNILLARRQVPIGLFT